MAYPKLTLRSTPLAHVDETPRGFRLSIPSGSSDSYRLAQLDDYSKLARKRFPHHSLTLSLSARTSSDSIAGTWGFGLWNDPFGMSLGFGGIPFRLPALPNAVWFFGASKEIYLSFKAPRAERSDEGTSRSVDEARVDHANRASSTGGANAAPPSAPPLGTSQREEVANGFMAQTFRSPRFHPLLIPAGIALPFSRKTTRRLLSRVIDEDGIRLSRGDPSESAKNLHSAWRVAPTDWHRYRLDWSLKRVSFEVDNVQVFESPVSPNPPLGLVIWIDNQYAAFTPEGKIGFGVLQNEEAWLEVKDLEIKNAAEDGGVSIS